MIETQRGARVSLVFAHLAPEPVWKTAAHPSVHLIRQSILFYVLSTSFSFYLGDLVHPKKKPQREMRRGN